MTTQTFQNAAAALTFLMGGNARATLVSEKTGTRFTYRVRASDDGAVRFVSVLTGQDNEGDYTFVGTVVAGARFRWSLKSSIKSDAPSVRAFEYALGHLASNRMPPQCKVYHVGRCGKCGRALTVPTSIESGFGPECAKHVH